MLVTFLLSKYSLLIQEPDCNRPFRHGPPALPRGEKSYTTGLGDRTGDLYFCCFSFLDVQPNC